MQSSYAPSPNAAPGVHDKVIELYRDGAQGRVLDAPAGPGALSGRLAEMGFKVTAFDIDEASFSAGHEGLVFTKGDLNLDLPYPGSSFECVVCVEGVEHLEDIYHLLRQFARVLIPGGKLIITTPNILNLASRIKFLLFGTFRYFNSRIEVADKSLAGHIHPVSFQELEYALAKTGFSVEEVATNTDMKRWRLPCAAFAALARWINLRFNKAYNPFLCSPEVLFGDIVIVRARRSA